jgi:hypothetical protein
MGRLCHIRELSWSPTDMRLRRQIGRWSAMRRHVSQIRRNCETGDLFRRQRQRQALLGLRQPHHLEAGCASCALG